jgi:hypothetical protein
MTIFTGMGYDIGIFDKLSILLQTYNQAMSQQVSKRIYGESNFQIILHEVLDNRKTYKNHEFNLFLG